LRKRSIGTSFLTLIASLGLFAMPLPAQATACTGGTDFTSTGDGTVSDPYEISSASDLIFLSNNQGGRLSSHFTQTANIDLAGCAFTPIGSIAAPFSGTYKGSGKTISGLSVAATSAGAGLFGRLSGSVEKLGLTSVQITGNQDKVGALAGVFESGSISQVYATGSVSGREIVGGLVGDVLSGTITDSWTNVALTATNKAGGFAGQRNMADLQRNYSLGSISSLGVNVGGFLGSQVISMVSVSGNYYNSTTSGRSTSVDGLALNTENFRVRANFSGWDFTTPIWKIDGSANNGFPYLAWQSVVPSVASTVGKDFWVTFDRNYQTGGRLELYISSANDASALVSYPDGSNETVNLQAGVTRIVDTTSKMVSRINTQSDVILNNALRVTSSEDISVYSMHFVNNSTDASVSIPVSSLGYEYMAIAPVGNVDPTNSVARMSIIAVEPGTTTVTINPKVPLTNRAANTPYSVTLTQGQVYTVTTTAMVSDITGSLITSNRKISLQTANFIWSHPLGLSGAADFLYEVMPPTYSWGTEAFAVRGQRLSGSGSPDVARVVALQDGTQVSLNGSITTTLNAGEFYDFALVSSGIGVTRVTGNKPISVVHLTSGSLSYSDGKSTVSGDPAMAIQPPITQYLNNYVVATPASDFPVNIFTVVVKQSEKSLVTRNGYAIGASAFTDIPNSSYAVARVPVGVGTQYFRSPSGFMLQAAGYDGTDSYAYPGGFGLVDPVQYPGGVAELQQLQSPTKPISVGGESISGNANLCSTLTAVEGSWLDGRSAITGTSLQWFRNGLPIGGATNSTLPLAGYQVGDLISFEVRKTNALGTTSAFSQPVRIVDNLLTGLAPSVGSLSPSFATCTTSYSMSVIQNWVSFTLDTNPDSALRINGSPVLAGQRSGAFTLNLGLNNFAITVTRGSQIQTYSVAVTYNPGPTVAMQPVSSLGATTATLNASVNPNGNQITAAVFEYATLADFSNSVSVSPTLNASLTTHNLTRALSGLVGGQRYFVRASVTNQLGTVTSTTFEFTTLSAPTLSSITVARDSVDPTKLNLSASVTPNGSSTQLIARYSSNPNLSNFTDVNLGAVATTPSSRSGSILNLPKGGLVYYQLRVENQHGTNYGPITEFQMRALVEFAPPTITPSATGAEIEFPLNPWSSPTSSICISATPITSSVPSNVSCGSNTTATPQIIDGNEFQTARISISGLLPNTSYYAVASARNSPLGSGVTTTSEGFTFTTLASSALTSNLAGPASVGPNDSILLTFRFSQAITGFTKTNVLLSGATSGWTTQPVFEVEPGLYIMEVRPTGAVTVPSTLTISSANPGTDATGAPFPAIAAFNVSVVASAPQISYSGSPFTFAQFQSISPFSATNSGGVAASYSSSPALPAGLTINNQGQISGTPMSSQAAQSYTITATNSVGSSSAVISIAITSSALQPPTISYSPLNYSLQRDQAITPITPTLGGGAVSSVSITPALPAGLTMNSSTGVITGTPTVFSTAKNYVVTATNGSGSSSATIRIGTFELAPAITYSPTALALTQFASMTAVTPANSGSAAYFRVVSGALPTGLSLNSATGAITGTPGGTALSADQATWTTFVVRASNSAGVVDTTLTYKLLAAMPNVSYPSRTVIVRSPISSASPTRAAGSGAVVSYSISPALPAGMTLNSTTGAISGTPTAIPVSPNFTITATNGAGSFDASWTLTVSNAAPVFSYSTTSYVGNEQQSFTTVVPTVTSGANITFTVSPALPSGLSINPNTGVITGTPAVGTVQAATNYVVTGTNTSGSSTRTLSVRITNVPVMAFTYPNASLSVSEGAVITNQAPSVTAGSPTTWSISPALPSGLSFSTATGVISGNPARGTRQVSTSYLVTGGDGLSSNTFQVSIQVMAIPISFGYSVSTLQLEETTASVPRLPVPANGSILPLSFSISPALPAGLSFNTATGEISGTPAAGTEQVSTIYTITGVDGALSETTTVSIEIAAAPVVVVVVAPTTTDSITGPTIFSLSKKSARTGESLAAFGHTLSTVSYLEIAGVRVAVAELSDTRFAFDVPTGLKPGVYDLVVFSSFGKLTVQDAITILASEAKTNFWTKRMGSSVKVYAKNVIGSGKVQFVVNGREIAWIRASSSADPRLSSTGLDHYFVRTKSLSSGKNRFEILVSGKRVWFATYAKK